VAEDLTLGERLKIRSMVYVASEPIPRFWPMRTFIHHNPLFGLEHLPFDQAVEQGASLFHGRGYLPRQAYQRYRAQGKVDDSALRRYLGAFVEHNDPDLPGIDLEAWLWAALVSTEREEICPQSDWLDGASLSRALTDRPPAAGLARPEERLDAVLRARMARSRGVHSQLDLLFGTQISATLDDLLIKSCLDFFDEGQSVWQAPDRERGFYRSWKEVARRNVRLLMHSRDLPAILASEREPEVVIADALARLEVPEDSWQDYILHELTHLHGWAGFIRFRSQAHHYYWGERYPADLTDFLAIRMVLELTLVREAVRRNRCPGDSGAIERFVGEVPFEAYLRSELYGGTILAGWAQRVDAAIGARPRRGHQDLALDYIDAKRRHEAAREATSLGNLARSVGSRAQAALRDLSEPGLERMVEVLRTWERQEGYTWLRAMEAHYIDELIHKVRRPDRLDADKRPFAQAFFCIDVRSEPLRRHLEALGDYKTFGTAGFFGVPIGFLEYGNGSEQPLCPAIMSPKSLIVEIPADFVLEEEPLYGALSHVFHDLKESVLAPFVAVEAVGLLFSLGLIGRTVWPVRYHRTYGRLHGKKPLTRLLVDKLTPEQADSILRAVQRAMIVRALRTELGLGRDLVTDDDVRELREIALGNMPPSSALGLRLGLTIEAEEELVEKLRTVYRVDRHDASLQMERLGRLGFSLEEQAQYVYRALLSCGLERNFSRFVLMVGHESLSRNNPYESALDCGAAGGGHGLPNARVISAMANKADVRLRLRELGVVVPDDTWFVPAAHNTTTDEVTLHDLDLLPTRHLLYLERLQNGLAAATRRSAAERMATLEPPKTRRRDRSDAVADALRHANDWSQVRPEWGLCRNLYAVIGGRHLTEGVDLEGRVFLLSYDHRLDTDGRLLENLLSAPVVVGEWINLEHYFSTVDVHRFGSGSKAYHNVAGRFGVMTGNQSDLRTGLPLQTLYSGGEPYHEPLRLISLIEAPAAFVMEIVGRLPKVKSLIMGGWIRVIVLDPDDDYNALVLEDGTFAVHPRSALNDQPQIMEAAP
jgi:uncharacterized protein YbcC (UPF0753/DUF2309 family)